MPLELSYYKRKFTVSPIQLGDGSFALKIDGRTVSVTDETSDAREGQILSGTASENPTDPELVAMFLPQAFSGHFLASKILYEDQPNIQQLVADRAGIPLEEYDLWERLFAQYNAS